MAVKLAFYDSRLTSIIFVKHEFVLLAGMLAVFYSSYSFSDELGRLFTTPEERHMLEELRNEKSGQTEIMELNIEETNEEEGKARHESGSITLNGLVYRKNGNSTAWINSGNNREGNTSDRKLRIRTSTISPDTVQVELLSNSAGIKLKVGETYTLSSDTVEDIIEISEND
jgi:hypothetical protein